MICVAIGPESPSVISMILTPLSSDTGALALLAVGGQAHTGPEGLHVARLEVVLEAPLLARSRP